MSIPRPYYRDLDFVDVDRDELVSAAFFDELALPPARPSRNRFRPSLADTIREALLTPEVRARSTRAATPAPAASGSSAARGHLPSKENHA